MTSGKKTGIYSTIGMSNANPLLAKLALDNEAKRTPTMRANWSYENVETKVWSIPHLTDFWGIGSRTEKRLHKLEITSIKELANSNPERLKKEFGRLDSSCGFMLMVLTRVMFINPINQNHTGLATLRCYLVTMSSSVILRLFLVKWLNKLPSE